jgi:hypothetical protein
MAPKGALAPFVPEELPDCLSVWKGHVQKLLDSADDIGYARWRFFASEAAAEADVPGVGRWSWEVFETMSDYVRRHVGWPVPSTKKPKALGWTLEEKIERADGSPYEWAWLELPIPWLEASGAHLNLFPLPIAILQGGQVMSETRLLSIASLWHLLPLKTPLAQFVSHRNLELWAFFETARCIARASCAFEEDVRPEESLARRR